MAYQVTARKWRPQTFAELVGQEHVARTLQNALRHGRLAHAYLFTGTRGVGKTTTARILAKALNCERGPTADPCNECALCQAITVGNSLDVLEIDGASNRGIDEIRDLREKIRYAPARSRYKIYIIDEVHMLTEHAFNALLKTLEEPPPQVVFIFATTEPHKVPITILSRCQRFDFRKVATPAIAACLGHIAQQEGLHISPTTLHRIARRAEGSLRDAQTLFDQVVAFCGTQVRDDEVALLLGLAGEEQLPHLMAAILAREARAVLDHLALLFQQGQDARELCRQLLAYIRDMIVVKVAPHGTAALDRSAAEVEAMQKLGAQVSLDELHTLFDLLSTTEAKIRDSAQPIWVLEVALIKLASLPPLRPLESLVARLETLEHRLGQTSLRPASPPITERPSLSKMVRERGAPLEGAALATDATLPPTTGTAPPLAADLAQVPAAPADLVQKIIESASTRALGWILEQHCELRLTESALEIRFHGHNRMARELLHEGETQRTLQQMAHTVIGRAIAVRVIDAPEPNGREKPSTTDSPPAGEGRLPLPQSQVVRDTLELFGGRILDIRERSMSREATLQPLSADDMVSEEDNDDE
jgi:DNA polymerase-3 subunit gamma/tau